MHLPPIALRVCTVASTAAALVLTGCAGNSEVYPTASASELLTSDTVDPTRSTDPTEVDEGFAMDPDGPTASPEPEPTSGSGVGGPVADGNVVIAVAETDEALGVLRAQASIQGVNVDDGTCTLTADNGTSTVTTTAPALFNVDRTDCGALELQLDDLAPGEWTISVEADINGYIISPDSAEVAIR